MFVFSHRVFFWSEGNKTLCHKTDFMTEIKKENTEMIQYRMKL